MTKLNPKTAQAIANLITSINAYNIMRESADGDNATYWLAQEFQDIIKLKEKYGIPHHHYALAVSCMKNDRFANAKLKKSFKSQTDKSMS
jgi:hypothetical protein